MSAYRTWDDKGLHTPNLCVVELEAQGFENLPEWQKNLNMSLDQVGCEEVVVKYLQVTLGDSDFT